MSESRTDVFTREKRSDVMSRIKGKDSKPEKAVRSLLYKHGYRFRLHKKDLPGRPDIVLPKYKTVIFVHGCFWHQHDDCTGGRLPKSNLEFWKPKLMGNKERDQKKICELQERGWRVLVLWECRIKKDIRSIEKMLLEEL